MIPSQRFIVPLVTAMFTIFTPALVAAGDVYPISGHVDSADTGEPVPVGLVRLSYQQPLYGIGMASLDSEGNFTIQTELYLSGTYPLYYQDDFFAYPETIPVAITCTPGVGCSQDGPITFSVYYRGGNIEGTVLGGQGRPVPWAGIVARAVGGSAGGYASADATGYYRFWALPQLPNVSEFIKVPKGGSQEYEVSIYWLPPGYGPPPPAQRVTVRGGRISRADFRFAPPENRAAESAQGPPTDGCGEIAVGRPVHVATGNMYTQQEDLAYASVFGRFAFTRTYNSQSTYSGPLGPGWTHALQAELKELRPGVIRVRNGAGNIRFYDAVSGSPGAYAVAAPARDRSALLKHETGYTETEADGLRREFDLQGHLVAIRNRAGWTTNFTYAGDQLSAATDPGGRTLTFTYAGDRLTRVEGPGGLAAQYAYDAQNRLVSVSDALGVRWTYVYTETTPSRLAAVRDANGHLVEQHAYDAEGRVVASTGPGGFKGLNLAYVDASHTRVTDSLGRVTTYTYEIRGDTPVLTEIQGPCPCGGPDARFAHDDRGWRVSRTDALGRTTRFAYDAAGNLAEITEALNQTTMFTYNAFGQVLTQTDAAGYTTRFEYDDPTGALVTITDALGHRTAVTPDTRSLLAAVTNARGFATTYTHSPAGLLTALTDPAGATTSFAYDEAGRLLVLTDPLDGRTTYAYDARGRLLSVTDPAGGTTAYAYDATGNRTRVTDANGRTTASAYDQGNRLLRVTNPAGGVTRFAYDTEGNLLSVTDAKGQTTVFGYDEHNRLIRRTDPLGASEHLLYDAVGNVLGRTDRKGQTFRYAYDALNRLATKTLPDGSTVEYAYDPLGRLLAVTDVNGSLAFTYDALGRVLTTTSQDGRTLRYAYDAVGNRTALQDETGAVTTYTYDARNLLTTLTDPRAGQFAFEYDGLGRRIALNRPNATATIYGYDAASRLVALAHAGPQGPFEALGYAYDAAGNRLADTRNGARHAYTYDPLDQLATVTGPQARRQSTLAEAYTYDPVGNRLTGPDREAYAYDAGNRLTADHKHAYSYDANGNLIEQRSIEDGSVSTFAYDADDRLIGVVTPTVEVAFQYDPLGRRTEKRVIAPPSPADGEEAPGTLRYLYDAEDLLATVDDAGNSVARYTHGPGIDEPLAELRGATLHLYHADALGTVLALSEKHGHPVRSYAYSAFGVPQDHRGDGQPYRFTGREWEKEIGLYYYRARYYLPRYGRFLQSDPSGFQGGPNFYLYVGGNPLRYVDPFGLWLTSVEIANIVFNETRSLSGAGVEEARRNIAHAVINADIRLGAKRPVTAPTTAVVPRVESAIYQACVRAVSEARAQQSSGIDPTYGAMHFNFRNTSSTAPFFGIPIQTQVGPLNNSYTASGLNATGVYANTYGGASK